MRELERDLPTDAALAADAPPFSRLAVIGAGRAGRSIATAATAAGLTSVSPAVMTRSTHVASRKWPCSVSPTGRSRRRPPGLRRRSAASVRRPRERRHHPRRARRRERRGRRRLLASPAADDPRRAHRPDRRPVRDLGLDGGCSGARPGTRRPPPDAALRGARGRAGRLPRRRRDGLQPARRARGVRCRADGSGWRRRAAPRAARAARPPQRRELGGARSRCAHGTDRARRHGHGGTPPEALRATAPELVPVYEALAERAEGWSQPDEATT